MTNKPRLGKTRHRSLIGDLDSTLDRGQETVAELITDIRRQQERSGRVQLQDFAMMVAEIAQVLGQARALAREMSDLVEQAPGDLSTDDTARLYELVADLQRQIDELKASSDDHLDENGCETVGVCVQ